MDRLLTLFVTLVVAAAAAGGGVWLYDRHPPISVTVPVGPFRPTFNVAHKSLKQERDEAVTEAERLAKANAACLAGIDAQNASIVGLGEQSARALAEASNAVRRARQGQERADRAVAALTSVRPASGDLCADYEAADADVRRAIQ